jgi:glycosyltransferase involved in cell wall biosynthesis
MSEVRRPSRLDARARAAPRLLYVVSEDWYFLSHRLSIARAARAAGFEVHVATDVTEDAEEIAKEGFTLHPLRFMRKRLAPFRTLGAVLALRKIYRNVNPAIVHHIALRPSVLGILASIGRRFAAVYGISGLGHTVVDATGTAAPPGRPTAMLLRLGLSRHGVMGLVQNPDDQAKMEELGVKPEHMVLLPGCGIDADRLRPMPEPVGAITVAYVGRMLEDKGLHTLMATHRMLRGTQTPCELLLAGSPDPAIPTSIPQLEIAAWGREPGVTWLGQVADVATIWRRAHIAVLPSRGGEGLPMGLLEAAACGRPLIATDVPGNREIVVDGKTGLLVPVDDPQALAAAILRLARSSQQRIRFGVAARRLVDERFSAELVGKETIALYRRLMETLPA